METKLENLIKLLEYPDGGFTYSFTGQEVPSTGYMVSDKPNLEKFVYNDVKENIYKFIQANISILKNQDYYLGAWRDPVDQYVGLSVSRYVKTYEEAYKIAYENRQISIYDLEKKKSIRIKY